MCLPVTMVTFRLLLDLTSTDRGGGLEARFRVQRGRWLKGGQLERKVLGIAGGNKADVEGKVEAQSFDTPPLGRFTSNASLDNTEPDDCNLIRSARGVINIQMLVNWHPAAAVADESNKSDDMELDLLQHLCVNCIELRGAPIYAFSFISSLLSICRVFNTSSWAATSPANN